MNLGPRKQAGAAYVNDLQGIAQNAKNYGVVGDGKVDDTAALQKAINNSSTLFVPAGIYRITDTLEIGPAKDAFHFFGEGTANSVSAVAKTRFVWDGPPNLSMLRVISVANVRVEDFCLFGRNNDFISTSPGAGLEVTCDNALGSMHFSNFERIDCSYIDGSPGAGILVGSLTNDDVSNCYYEYCTMTFCNECIRQIGGETVNNFYNNNVFLEYLDKGINYVKGNAHLTNNGFYGSTSAKEDVLISEDILEFVAKGNYHEIILNRTGASAFTFPLSALRIEPTVIDSSRIITIVADVPNLIDYRQAGPLSVTNCIIGSLNTGNAIFADSQAVGAPVPLSLQGTISGDSSLWSIVVKGNWNFQQSSFKQLRSYFQVTVLADSAESQDIFPDPFTIQDETTYNVSFSLQVTRTSGTTAHTISMVFDGTANVVITEMNYITRQSNTDYDDPIAPLMSSQSGAAPAILTASNSSANEFVSIVGKGQIRSADSGAGSWIPQLLYSAAPGGAPEIRPNSFIEIEPVGNIGVVNLNPF